MQSMKQRSLQVRNNPILVGIFLFFVIFPAKINALFDWTETYQPLYINNPITTSSNISYSYKNNIFYHSDDYNIGQFDQSVKAEYISGNNVIGVKNQWYQRYIEYNLESIFLYEDVNRLNVYYSRNDDWYSCSLELNTAKTSKRSLDSFINYSAKLKPIEWFYVGIDKHDQANLQTIIYPKSGASIDSLMMFNQRKKDYTLGLKPVSNLSLEYICRDYKYEPSKDYRDIRTDLQFPGYGNGVKAKWDINKSLSWSSYFLQEFYTGKLNSHYNGVRAGLELSINKRTAGSCIQFDLFNQKSTVGYEEKSIAYVDGRMFKGGQVAEFAFLFPVFADIDLKHYEFDCIRSEVKSIYCRFDDLFGFNIEMRFGRNTFSGFLKEFESNGIKRFIKNKPIETEYIDFAVINLQKSIEIIENHKFILGFIQIIPVNIKEKQEESQPPVQSSGMIKAQALNNEISESQVYGGGCIYVNYLIFL